MTKKKKLMDYVNEFIECGELQGISMLNGEYKEGNKAYSKTEKILKIAKNDEKKEEFYITVLSNATDANTLTKCCAHMFRLDINSKIAREKLQEISGDEEIHPIFRSNAQLFLQEWDKGNIKKMD